MSTGKPNYVERMNTYRESQTGGGEAMSNNPYMDQFANAPGELYRQAQAEIARLRADNARLRDENKSLRALVRDMTGAPKPTTVQDAVKREKQEDEGHE